MKIADLTIVAFGDSITNGVGHFGVTEGTCFRGRIERGLKEDLRQPVRVMNAGVNGDVTPVALERFDSDVAAASPQIVTILFGVNDAGFYRPQDGSFADTPRVGVEEFTSCLRRITERVLSLPARPVLVTPLPMNHHYWGADHPPYVEHGLNFLVERYAQRVREVAAGLAVPLVDLYHCFATDPETVDLIPDGIHPNPEGHRIIAELLMPVLRESAD